MLDKFIVGRVTRISPEAPVPVVAFDHEMHRIGGAANVAHNIAALGGRATLIAVTGQDDAAATLTQACREAGIAPCARRRRVTSDDDEGRASSPSATSRWRASTTRPTSEIDGEVEQRVVAAVKQHASRAAGDRRLGLSEGLRHAESG